MTEPVRQLELFPPPDARTRPSPATHSGSALSSVVTDYLVDLARLGKARHTLDAAARDLDQLGAAVGDQAIRDVSSEDLSRFVDLLRRERSNSVASTRRKIATVKSFFRFARRHGHVRDDPSAVVPYPALEEREAQPLSLEQADRLVASAPTEAHQTLLLLMLDAGLKREEVLALEARDVSFENGGGSVQVSRAIAAKRVRARSVPLTPRLAGALRHHLQERAPHEALFELSTRGVDYIVREAGDRAGVPPHGALTPQRLRDSYAVGWLAERLPGERAELHQDAGRRLEAEHDRALTELLGLVPGSLAVARYRRAAARFQHDRAEAAGLSDA